MALLEDVRGFGWTVWVSINHTPVHLLVGAVVLMMLSSFAFVCTLPLLTFSSGTAWINLCCE